MNIKTSFIACLSLLLFLSCEKNTEVLQYDSFFENARLKTAIIISTVHPEDSNKILYEYEYDSLNRLSKIIWPMYENREISGVFKYYIYNYNSLGQLENISFYNANRNSQTGFIKLKNYIYSYSDSFLIKKILEYPRIDSYEYSLLFYVENLAMKEEFYNDDDELIIYAKNEYNHLGALLKKEYFSKDGIVLFVITNEYERKLKVLTNLFIEDQVYKVAGIERFYDSDKGVVQIKSHGVDNFYLESNGYLIFPGYQNCITIMNGLDGNWIEIESDNTILYSSDMNYELQFEYYKN